MTYEITDRLPHVKIRKKIFRIGFNGDLITLTTSKRLCEDLQITKYQVVPKKYIDLVGYSDVNLALING